MNFDFFFNLNSKPHITWTATISCSAPTWGVLAPSLCILQEISAGSIVPPSFNSTLPHYNLVQQQTYMHQHHLHQQQGSDQIHTSTEASGGGNLFATPSHLSAGTNPKKFGFLAVFPDVVKDPLLSPAVALWAGERSLDLDLAVTSGSSHNGRHTWR